MSTKPTYNIGDSVYIVMPEHKIEICDLCYGKLLQGRYACPKCKGRDYYKTTFKVSMETIQERVYTTLESQGDEFIQMITNETYYINGSYDRWFLESIYIDKTAAELACEKLNSL